MARILVIEDEAPIRANLLRFLMLEGHELFEAENGQVGLELARKLRPDLILCDMMMPVLDGLGVLEGLRADPAIAQTPFILLTAAASREQIEQGLTHGASAYVTKPFILGDVRSLIARHLAAKGSL
jgi:CheY-like chemotaxis protein